MYPLKLTAEELLLLARLIGHHTSGNGLGRVYDVLHDTVRDHLALDVSHLPPLPNSNGHEIYGDRAMVKVNKE